MKSIILRSHKEGKSINEICEKLFDYCPSNELRNNDRNKRFMLCADEDHCYNCIKSHVRRVLQNTRSR